ncbi:hypothetical protein DsansV1_C05g0054111 [Dioscorea sansibarensis]
MRQFAIAISSSSSSVTLPEEVDGEEEAGGRAGDGESLCRLLRLPFTIMCTDSSAPEWSTSSMGITTNGIGKEREV